MTVRAVAGVGRAVSQPAITLQAAAGLPVTGVLEAADPAKADAALSLRRLAHLGVTVKLVTGDSDRTARAVRRELGLDVSGVLSSP